MNTIQRDRRAQRAAKPNLEYLDDRIVPSTMHTAVGAGAEAVAAVSVAQRHEQHLLTMHAAIGAGAEALSAASAVQRHEQRLARLEAKHERAVARHQLLLARREARYIANHPNAAPRPTIPTSPGPLPANVGQGLQTIYQEYQTFQSAGGTGTFTSSQANLIVINGTNVGVEAHSNGGDFNAFVAALKSDGLQILASDATYGIVEGMLPITELPTIAVLPQTLSITPMYKPMLN
jgi:hypothetical protein